MSTVLVTPPHYYLSCTLAVPQLCSFLESAGYKAHQIDIDRLIYTDLLNENSLGKVLSSRRNVPKEVDNANDNLSYALQKQLNIFNTLLEKKKYANWQEVWEEQEDLLQFFSQNVAVLEERFLTLPMNDFRLRLNRLEASLMLLASPFTGVSWSPINGIEFPGSPHSSRDIVETVEDERINFLLPYYSDTIIPVIKERQPYLVGISINHFSQMIPGYSLAAVVRQEIPEVRIVIGGTAISQVIRFVTDDNPLWRYFDFSIIGSGELPLLELCHMVNGKIPRHKVSGLVYRDSSGVRINNRYSTLALDDIPTPRFLEKRPRPIIPISTSIGCDYAKCAFCYYPYLNATDDSNNRTPYATRSIDKVVLDIRKLQKEFKPLYVHLTDTDVPPTRIEQMTDELRRENACSRLFAFVRAGGRFTSREFCAKIASNGFISGYFGLESACPRTNSRMNKGVKLEDALTTLDNFHQAGIITNLFCMVGFPGETEQEANLTLDFLEKYGHLIPGEISISFFHLKWNSEVYRKPEKFGITNISHRQDHDLISRYDYEVTHGLSQKDAVKIAEQFNSKLGVSYVSNRMLFTMMERFKS